MSRLDRSERDRRLRAALERRKASSWSPDTASPCNWWGRAQEQAHREWIARELEVVPFASLTWLERVTAGQPVLLPPDAEGLRARAWIRLVGGTSFERWPAPGEGRGVCHTELTFRNPRDPELWGDPYVLQLAIALLDAHSNPEGGHAWLAGCWKDPTCPGLAELLEDALAELAPPLRPTRPEPQPVAPEPPSRRGWQPRELELMGVDAQGNLPLIRLPR